MSEWRTIEDYPDYEVSDDGQVKSFKNGKERILKGCDNGDGHLRVNLNRNGKQKSFLIHRLMAKEFIPNPRGYPFVRHLNDIPYDNRIENLEWGTPEDNTRDSIKNGTHVCLNKEHMDLIRQKDTEKTSKPVIAIKNGICKKYNSRSEASRALGVSIAHISSCVNGKRMTTGGYSFKEPKPRHKGKV